MDSPETQSPDINSLDQLLNGKNYIVLKFDVEDLNFTEQVEKKLNYYSRRSYYPWNTMLIKDRHLVIIWARYTDCDDTDTGMDDYTPPPGFLDKGPIID